MERSFADDLRAALAVFTGGVLGYIVFDIDDPSALLGGVIGLVLMIMVLNALRFARRRRHP
jgi:TctA family transporter